MKHIPTPNYSWTTADAAEYLHSDQYFVRYLANNGLLPYLAIHSRCWRFDPDEVKAAAKKLGLRIVSDADATDANEATTTA